MGIKIAVIEPGKNPYLKEVEPETRSDGKTSHLKAFKNEVGGLIEYFEPLWGDRPALITNEEFLSNGSEPNRAIYANERIHDTGYIDMMTYSHVPEVGELYGLMFGTFIAVSHDEEGNPRDMPDDEWSKVLGEFAGEKSINSCVLEILKIRERRRQELGE